MPFSAPFREPNIAPIFSPGGAVIPWYLLGGVTAAQCVAAYQPKGAADLVASKVNLNNPGTYDAAAGTNPSFATATGWTFDGATQYLVTGIIPTFSAGKTAYSMLVQYSGVTLKNSACVAGLLHAAVGKRFDLIPWFQFGDVVIYGNGTTLTVAPQLQSGNLGMAASQGYRNGVADGGAISAGTVAGAVTYDIYLGAQHAAAGAVNFFGASIKAVAIYNITLSSTQVGLIAAAMAAL